MFTSMLSRNTVGGPHVGAAGPLRVAAKEVAMTQCASQRRAGDPDIPGALGAAP